MARRTGKKQIKANRQNALKSTGPRTSQGKNIVGRNALKHGMTAVSPLSVVCAADESPEEYNQLVEQLRHDLKPAGTIEDLLVLEIANAVWRKSRIYRAEAGQIEKSILDGEREYREKMIAEVRFALSNPTGRPLGEILSQSSEGLQTQLDILLRARSELAEDGRFQDKTRDEITSFFYGSMMEAIHAILKIEQKIPCTEKEQLRQIRNLMDKCRPNRSPEIRAVCACYEASLGDSEALEEGADDKADESKAEVIAAAEEIRSMLKELLDAIADSLKAQLPIVRQREETQRRVLTMISSIPQGKSADLILRYGREADRSFQTSLSRLLDLQQRRAG